MNLFTPPKTNYVSVNDVSKFNMMWNVSLVLIPVFFSLFTFHILVQDQSWSTSLLATLVAVVNIFVLRSTRKFLLIAISSVACGVIITQASVFITPDSYLISDVMWALLVGVFAFFLLGSFVGFIVLMGNITGIILFLVMGDEVDIIRKGISLDQINEKMIFNAYFVAVAFSFIVHKMIQNIREGNKRYEQEIYRNEVLLKEIHHRVKNNLQIISSLLRLQAAESNNEDVEDDFGEAISRIRSMALIHEKMYNNDDLARIDIKSYLEALVDDITNTIHSNCKLKVVVHSEIEQIDIKSIVPISLIFNELITNSIKHGFLESNEGDIKVEIVREGAIIHFKYSDSGIWKKPQSEATFGLELIKTLTSQLDGEFELKVGDGTKYNFIFPANQFFFAEESPN